MLGKITFTLKQ